MNRSITLKGILACPPPSELPPSPPAPPSLPPGYVVAVSGYYQLKSGSCGGAVIEETKATTKVLLASGLLSAYNHKYLAA